MGRGWRPVLAGAAVVVGVFLLAQWPIFEPSVDTSTPAVPAAGGSTARGQVVFESECAGCHGPGGEGGTGPRLAGSGLDATEIAATIRQGAGIMPPALVTGPDEAEVVAYVVAIATP
ncbi:MAG: c-type cytochrome [Gemmatimonadota bacterium]